MGHRLRTLPAVYDHGTTRLLIGDSYYYLRLARLSAESFPRPVERDSFVAYPGMPTPWPPGHAWLLAGVDALGGHADPGPIAWVDLVVALGGAALLMALAWRELGWAGALALGATILVIPAAADASSLGEADHHVHEVFFFALAPLLLLRAIRQPLRPARGVAAGVAVATAHLFTTSAWLLLPPIAVAMGLAHRKTPDAWRRLEILHRASRTAFLGVGLLVAVQGRLGEADVMRLSGFQVAVLAAITLASALPLAIAEWRRGRRRTGEPATALIALGVLAALAPGAVSATLLAARQLGHGSVILADVNESWPLFSRGLADALGWLGGALVALPLVAFLLGRAAWRRQADAPWVLALLALMTIPVLFQGRFARPLAGTLGVAAAVAVAAAMAPREGRKRWAAVLPIAAIVALALPVPAIWQGMVHAAPELTLLESSLRFLRESTPSPLAAGDPEHPTYAVLAPWYSGHLVVALGERPVLGSPFGQTPRAEEAASETVALLADGDPEHAYRECRRLGLRYVLAHPWPDGFARLAEQGGRTAGQGAPTLLEALWRGGMASGHWRPVFVSTERIGAAPAARVFEVVEGARLVVEGPPDTPLGVEIRRRVDGTVVTLPGRTDGAGRAEFRLPYLPGDLEGGVLRIGIAGAVLLARPTEQAVREGLVFGPSEIATDPGAAIPLPGERGANR